MRSTVIRSPRGDDALAIWQAVAACPQLDKNSWYCYFLLCTHFSGTCAVAEDSEGLAGFITGFLSGSDPATLFIWQLWVDERVRRQGVAAQLAEWLIARSGGRIRRVQATVDPGNTMSIGFIEEVAQRNGGQMTRDSYLAADAFPDAEGAHGPEDLVSVNLSES